MSRSICSISSIPSVRQKVGYAFAITELDLVLQDHRRPGSKR
jgi:hypothetical protein